MDTKDTKKGKKHFPHIPPMKGTKIAKRHYPLPGALFLPLEGMYDKYRNRKNLWADADERIYKEDEG